MTTARSNSSLGLGRRAFLGIGAGLGAMSTVGFRTGGQVMAMQDSLQAGITGDALPGLEAWDGFLAELLAAFGLPGGQMAIAVGDRLVYNRGVGSASPDGAEKVMPDSRFRFASVAKPFTTVAILMLVEQGKLELSTKVFPLLDYTPPAGAVVDPRIYDITIEQLLTHSGGFNSSQTGFDPQFNPYISQTAIMLGEPSPVSPQSIILSMMGTPLAFDPGTATQYSNFGYNLLGRVIEHITGKSYGEAMAEMVFDPIGAPGMILGQTLLADRAPREVMYMPQIGQTIYNYPSVYESGMFVPLAYGGYSMPVLDAHGGFIGSAEDAVKFALAVDGVRGGPLLSADMMTTMLTAKRPPAMGAEGEAPEETGLGWVTQLDEDLGGFNWFHTGALVDTCASLLSRFANGVTISWVFNSLPTAYVEFFDQAIAETYAVLTRTEFPTEGNLWE